jgi:hypothetical protein
MFFLLSPALYARITVPLSWWILDLRFVIGHMFYTGLGLVTVSLLFSAKILGEFAITIGHSPVFMLSAATVSWGSI